jgi:mannose-1-phosphate guanylyltransferase
MTDLSAWPALVLTAGLGTRLRPLSLVRAKAALPVAGDALVRRVLGWLRDAGVRRVVLNLHHLPETITPHVGDGSDLGLDVRYSWEPVILGSAGGPRRARPLLDAERFLIVNGDTLTEASLTALTARHLASGARVTMTVTPGDVKYGGVMADADDVVHGFARAEADRSDEATAMRPSELAALSRYHFVGIQAVEAEVFDDVRDDQPSETVRAVYPQLIAKRPGSVRIYRTDADFHDIGTPAGYLASAMRFGPGPQIGRNTHVHPTARIPGCIVWDRATIGPGAELVDCIVADDVAIAAGERHRRQAIVLVDGRTIVTPL